MLRSKTVLQMVAKYTDIPIRSILSSNRRAEVLRARDLATAIFLADGRCLSEIGRILSRHHSTIMAAKERIYKRTIGNDAGWYRDVDALGEQIRIINEMQTGLSDVE